MHNLLSVYNMDEYQKHILVKETRHKEYIIYDVIYRKYKKR